MLKNYKEKLTLIQAELSSMSQDVVDAVEDSYNALKSENISLLKKIDLSEKKLRAQSQEIDNMIVKTLALHSPEASDLRSLVAYLKITAILIRAGINVKTFSKLFRKTYSEDLNTKLLLEYAIPLNKSALSSIKTATSMIEFNQVEDIEEKYKKVIIEESKTDDLYSMIEKNILKLSSKNMELTRDYFAILSALRKLEKIADSSLSIANLLQFANIGGEIQS